MFLRCNTIWNAHNKSGCMPGRLCWQHHYDDRCQTPAPRYEPGRRVWLAIEDVPLKALSRKLAPCYIGTFEIETVMSPLAVKLKLPTALRIHPTFPISQIKPVHSSPPVSVSSGNQVGSSFILDTHSDSLHFPADSNKPLTTPT